MEKEKTKRIRRQLKLNKIQTNFLHSFSEIKLCSYDNDTFSISIFPKALFASWLAFHLKTQKKKMKNKICRNTQ